MNHLNARIHVYEILASLFRPPDDVSSGAEECGGRLLERLLNTVQECCGISARCCLRPGLMEEIRGLLRAFEEDEDQAGTLTRLAAEHTRLFVNAFPTLVAPPYESFYQEGRVMGKAALDCRSIYAEDGLTVREGGELPDHILTQMEYLRFLCLGEKRAADEGETEARGLLRERELSFIEEHILNWLPEFCGRIQSNSHEPYYRVLARFMKNFMVLEYRNLNHPVELDPFEEVFNDVKKV